jgi:hypothetical protein
VFAAAYYCIPAFLLHSLSQKILELLGQARLHMEYTLKFTKAPIKISSLQVKFYQLPLKFYPPPVFVQNGLDFSKNAGSVQYT